MIEMDCTCVQKHHSIPTEVIEVSDHAIEKVGDILKDYRRIFMVADENTYRVAGQRVEEILKEQGILSHTLVLPSPALPNAESIGKVLMEAGRDREVYDAPRPPWMAMPPWWPPCSTDGKRSCITAPSPGTSSSTCP